MALFDTPWILSGAIWLGSSQSGWLRILVLKLHTAEVQPEMLKTVHLRILVKSVK